MANLIKIFGICAFFLHCAVASAQSPIITPLTINLASVSSPQQATATLHNTTTSPLVITKIEADCRCTKAVFSRRPIAISDSTKITITYTPTSDEGVFYKAIKVYTSASREPLKFIVRGNNIQ